MIFFSWLVLFHSLSFSFVSTDAFRKQTVRFKTVFVFFFRCAPLFCSHLTFGLQCFVLRSRRSPFLFICAACICMLRTTTSAINFFSLSPFLLLLVSVVFFLSKMNMFNLNKSYIWIIFWHLKNYHGVIRWRWFFHVRCDFCTVQPVNSKEKKQIMENHTPKPNFRQRKSGRITFCRRLSSDEKDATKWRKR